MGDILGLPRNAQPVGVQWRFGANGVAGEARLAVGANQRGGGLDLLDLA